MGVITKAYTTTIVAGLTANASNVQRALDDIYNEFNGGINSANISAGFTWPASQININDTATIFSASYVEGVLLELANQISGSQIQDFTSIKNVGAASQQYAGHTFTTAEPGTTASELIALYIFGDSASKTTDEVGTYTLDVCNADVVSGIMGLSGGALSFTSATDSFAFNSALGNSFTSGFSIDFWIKPEQISAGTGYIFAKRQDGANNEFYGFVNNTGSLFFSYVAGGNIYTTRKLNYFITGTGNEWTYVVCSQDSSNGIRLFINGELAAIDISGTDSMTSGANSPFMIGVDHTAANPFHGYIGNFRVRKKVITQKDVDVGYATKYSLAKEYSNLDFGIKASIQQDGDSDFVRAYNFEELEIVRQSATIYRAGGIWTGFNSNTTLKLIGKVQ